MYNLCMGSDAEKLKQIPDPEAQTIPQFTLPSLLKPVLYVVAGITLFRFLK